MNRLENLTLEQAQAIDSRLYETMSKWRWREFTMRDGRFDRIIRCSRCGCEVFNGVNARFGFDPVSEILEMDLGIVGVCVNCGEETLRFSCWLAELKGDEKR